MIKYFNATYGNLVTNDTSVGDGFNLGGTILGNYFGYRWRAPFNLNNNANIPRLDYNLTAKGTQTLFWRGAIQNLSNLQAPFLPGTPPEQTLVDFSKGMAIGCTALIGSGMVNTFRYGFTRQSTGFVGNSNQPWSTFYTLDNSFTYSHNFQMPVHNFIDDFSWTKRKHTIQVGAAVGIARDPRVSFQHSFSQGKGATFWMQSSTGTLPSRESDSLTIGAARSAYRGIGCHRFGLIRLRGSASSGDIPGKVSRPAFWRDVCSPHWSPRIPRA